MAPFYYFKIKYILYNNTQLNKFRAKIFWCLNQNSKSFDYDFRGFSLSLIQK